MAWRPKLDKTTVLVVAILAAGEIGVSLYYWQHRNSSSATAPKSAFVNPQVCAGCHQAIAQSYAHTGMAHAFFQPAAANRLEDYSKARDFFHKPSNIHYAMEERDGKLFQRRWQTGYNGAPTNTQELQVDYVMGSGHHARAYLHRTAASALIELPLGWYAENGGEWAMSPGYDSPKFIGDRQITYECIFCHNAYPAIPPGSSDALYSGPLPEGIDCQRCHGPGAAHVAAAQSSKPEVAALRASIVNPARLSPDRQMDACMQCHLQTTSSALPASLRMVDREPFAYRPGQPLGDFRLYFDRANAAATPPAGQSIEIDNSAYRLRQSQCFLKSAGKLTCLTCHDPHNIPRAEQAQLHYNGVCQQCHSTALPASHPAATDCVVCHMPKRRTTDVVHAVMTDHLIQRRKPAGDLLAKLAEIDDEVYRGAVAPYYPSPFPQTPEAALYSALAQVKDGANPAAVTQLAAAIDQQKPHRFEFYVELANTFARDGDFAKAVPPLEEAARLAPSDAAVAIRLGVALRDAGELARAAQVLQSAAAAHPLSARALYELGVTQSRQGNATQAVITLQNAVSLNADFALAWHALGVALAGAQQPGPAEDAYRNALRLQPDLAETHANLALLLGAKSKVPESLFEFEEALRLRPGDAVARSNYAVALGEANRLAEAQHQLELSIKADPNVAETHEMLGSLMESKSQIEAAKRQYREAIRLKPDFLQARQELDALESKSRSR